MGQLTLFDSSSPPNYDDREATQRALDELFNLAKKYRTTHAYWELMEFIRRFRSYSPFNAMLVHIQMPGARFVAPASRWLNMWGRRVKPDARPLVILQPMGPVMFVFDVSDTEPKDGAPPLPPEVDRPFEVQAGQVGGELERTIENAKRDGVEVIKKKGGSQWAGQISEVAETRYLRMLVRLRPKEKWKRIVVRYRIELNASFNREAQYATLVHELAHLYCGHLGTPNPRWWPDRRRLPEEVREFEAESVTYLVCSRLGIENPSARYLSDYVKNYSETPPVSLDRIMASAGLIETMGMELLKPRPVRREEAQGGAG